ncbi:putative RNA methyltransferase, partial [Lacticaseibacillus camelliae]
MRKIEEKAKVMAQLAVFACPVCGEPLSVSGTSLLCPNGHRYDLAKKGTVNFLAKPSPTEYDTPMLEARRRVLQAGFFAPFIEAIGSRLGAGETVLDVGCGEGTPTAALAQSGALAVGFDISA